ncbi:MAG TPA: tRNA-dihydrouridine synthase, partial [Propionibacteriaceae bacterium]|nr:tRNA-dihydrouridine synthase [Propionibacteriaceae bacterium]
MAGITNAAYRQLCREQFESRADELRRKESTRFSSTSDDEVGGPRARFARSGAEQSNTAELGGSTRSLFVCEMITSRGLVERDPKTCAMLQFDPGERLRSVQLYGVDPAVMAQATEILITEYSVGHVDLNFGCPVPKVTRKGGGAVLPYKRDRLRMILEATVGAAEPYGVPVTMKTRIGIDDDHQTYLDAGRIAEQTGCAAIALHGRTAQQAYSGQADWNAIAALKAHVSIPVLGNGDIWEAADALRMVAETGVDGVVVGRGCLGRPWLFRDLANAFSGLH